MCALPCCVLQMTLKSSCSQTAFPLLSLCGSGIAVDLSVSLLRTEEEMKRGRKGKRELGSLLSFLYPNPTVIVPISAVGSSVISQHQHRLHLYRLA